LFPNARVIEFYGASETSFIAWMDATDDAPDSAPSQAVGKPFANVQIDIRPAPKGLIYVRSPMLFMDYVVPQSGAPSDHTAALRDGEWLSVRDVGTLDTNGWLCLDGRENRMIVTMGKNLFPEELEDVLQAHPAVAQASVHGVPDDLRGTQVVAVLRLRGAATNTQLSEYCRQRLEAYKAPRRYLVLYDWPQTPGGKTDHRAVSRLIANTSAPCLQTLP
jgi:acyl-CoA synthetase (AMP-forming)/AMP-acid ligase II